MPVLPLIDLMILSGWTSLMVGAAIKIVAMTTRYRPDVFGLSSMDFAVIAGICFGFALTLAARTWVKLNEPRMLAAQRAAVHLEGVRLARQAEEAFESEDFGQVAEDLESEPEAASADRRGRDGRHPDADFGFG